RQTPGPWLLVLPRLQDVEPGGATGREDRGQDPDDDRRDREDDQLPNGKCEGDEVDACHEQRPENDSEHDPERTADQGRDHALMSDHPANLPAGHADRPETGDLSRALEDREDERIDDAYE